MRLSEIKNSISSIHFLEIFKKGTTQIYQTFIRGLKVLREQNQALIPRISQRLLYQPFEHLDLDTTQSSFPEVDMAADANRAFDRSRAVFLAQFPPS